MPDIKIDNRWIETFTGKSFFPLEPEPDKICIEDIAHSLSLLCRFNGHCNRFYSVAEHSVRVASLVNQFVGGLYHPYQEIYKTNRDYKRDYNCEMYALLHDTSEAYISDIPRPIKSSLTNFKDIEKNIEKNILQKYCRFKYNEEKYDHFINECKPHITKADNILLATEARDLGMKLIDDWKLEEEPLKEQIIPYIFPEEAEEDFIRKFNSIQRSIRLLEY